MLCIPELRWAFQIGFGILALCFFVGGVGVGGWGEEPYIPWLCMAMYHIISKTMYATEVSRKGVSERGEGLRKEWGVSQSMECETLALAAGLEMPESKIENPNICAARVPRTQSLTRVNVGSLRVKVIPSPINGRTYLQFT